MSRPALARWFALLCDAEAMRARLEISALRSALLAQSTLARQAAVRAQRAQASAEHYRLLARELGADLRRRQSEDRRQSDRRHPDRQDRRRPADV